MSLVRLTLAFLRKKRPDKHYHHYVVFSLLHRRVARLLYLTLPLPAPKGREQVVKRPERAHPPAEPPPEYNRDRQRYQRKQQGRGHGMPSQPYSQHNKWIKIEEHPCRTFRRVIRVIGQRIKQPEKYHQKNPL